MQSVLQQQQETMSTSSLASLVHPSTSIPIQSSVTPNSNSGSIIDGMVQMMEAPLNQENQTSLPSPSSSSSAVIKISSSSVIEGKEQESNIVVTASDHVVDDSSQVMPVSSTPLLVVNMTTSSFSEVVKTTKIKSLMETAFLTPSKVSEVLSNSSSQMVNNIDPSKSLTMMDLSSLIQTVPVVAPETTSRTLCSDYRTVASDGSLSLDKALSTLSCDLKYDSAVRFISTSGDSLQLKEGCQTGDQQTRTCSGFDTNVWLNGSHPKVPGTTAMEVCIKSSGSVEFFYDYCRCERKDIFFVELCNAEDGNTEDKFYVYRLYPLFKSKGNEKDAKDCTLKYCTEIQPGK